MKQTNDVDVIIVGAGPVGLTLGNLLLVQGISFKILTSDSEPRPVYESRAEGVHIRTLLLFERLGLLEDALKQGRPLHGVSLYSGGIKRGRFSLDDPDSELPGAIVLEQGKVERILAKKLNDSGQTIFWGHTFRSFKQQADHVELALTKADGSTHRLSSKYMVGCDGAHSATRKASGLEFEGGPHPGSYALADVEIDWEYEELDSDVHVFMSPLLLLGRLKEGSWKVATLIPNDQVQPDSPDEILATLQLQMRKHGVNATFQRARWTSNFRISNRCVRNSRQGRVFLAGDAAHIHSPMGGQGMNEGIHDAANLAWKLALVLKGQANDRLLNTYSQERLPLIADVLKETELMTNIVEIEGAGKLLRDQAVSIATSIDLLQPALREQFTGASRKLGPSSILSEYKMNLPDHLKTHAQGDFHPNPLDEVEFAKGPAPGCRAPNPSGLFTFGRSKSVSMNQMLVSDPRHTLVVFEGQHIDAINRIKIRTEVSHLAKELGSEVRAIVVSTHEMIESITYEISDPLGNAHRAFGARTICSYFLRPDGFIGFRSLPFSAREITSYWNRLLNPA